MCDRCDDTGWKAVVTDGVRRVVRCDCWRDGVMARLLEEARIPPRYRGCELETFVIYPNEKLTAAVRHAQRFAEDFPRGENARKGLLQARKVARNTDSALAARLLSYAVAGRTFAWDKAFEARIAALTPEEVREAMRRHLKVDDLTTVKAGDFSKVTAKATETKSADAKPN